MPFQAPGHSAPGHTRKEAPLTVITLRVPVRIFSDETIASSVAGSSALEVAHAKRVIHGDIKLNSPVRSCGQ